MNDMFLCLLIVINHNKHQPVLSPSPSRCRWPPRGRSRGWSSRLRRHKKMLGEDGFFHVFSMCFLQVLMVFLGPVMCLLILFLIFCFTDLINVWCFLVEVLRARSDCLEVFRPPPDRFRICQSQVLYRPISGIWLQDAPKDGLEGPDVLFAAPWCWNTKLMIYEWFGL